MQKDAGTGGGSRATAFRAPAAILLSIVLAGTAFPQDLPPIRESGKEIDWARERDFWSLKVPAGRPAPRVKDASWPRKPLDSFVLARLEEAGLSPSPEAEPR